MNSRKYLQPIVIILPTNALTYLGQSCCVLHILLNQMAAFVFKSFSSTEVISLGLYTSVIPPKAFHHYKTKFAGMKEMPFEYCYTRG